MKNTTSIKQFDGVTPRRQPPHCSPNAKNILVCSLNSYDWLTLDLYIYYFPAKSRKVAIFILKLKGQDALLSVNKFKVYIYMEHCFNDFSGFNILQDVCAYNLWNTVDLNSQYRTLLIF